MLRVVPFSPGGAARIAAKCSNDEKDIRSGGLGK